MNSMPMITYQFLEEKYVESAIDCILETKIQNGSVGEAMQLTREQLEQSTRSMFQNQKIFENTYIAVDQSKENFVAGIVIFVEYYDYLDYLSTPSEDSQLDMNRIVLLKASETQIKFNYNPGDFLVFMSFGVRKGYENQKIGHYILYKCYNQALNKGYCYLGGVIYNPKSGHICQKYGAKIVGVYSLQQMSDLNQNLTKFLQNDIYFIRLTIQENISKQNSEYVSEQPRL
ncbi:hypothetical protein ABPG74_021919 [Tetrahymena malaccensis]